MTNASASGQRRALRGRTLRLLPVASASLAVALLAQSAQAQQQGTPPAEVTPPANTTPPATDGQDIVVTAQKREESLQKVPISIAVLGGRALDRQSSGGTLAALTLVPAVAQSTSDAGGMTQISIRGVAPAVPFGGGSSTTGYYIDSIPFALVRTAAVPSTNVYDLSRIEVLRGPQGTLYGASALNGVVRILTNDADPTKWEFKARGGVSTTKGGDASFRTDAAVNVPLIADRLAIRIVGGVERLGGWIDQPVRGKRNANSSLSDDVRVKLDARPTDRLRIDLEAWLSRSQYDAANYADDAGNQSTPLPQPGSTKYGAYNAKVTYDLPFMTISSATSKIYFRQKILTDFSYAAPIDPHLLQLYSDLPARVFSEELLLNSNGDGPWRLSAGAFYRKANDDRYQTLPAVLAGKAISWSDRSKSYAVFGQITRTFADDRFELTGGLRYFHDDVDTVTLTPPNSLLPAGKASVKAHAVTPRVVATWLPNPHLTAYASYSQGFRSALNQTPLTLLAAPLPPAKSDKLDNYEVGAKGSVGNGLLTYDVSAFYIKWNKVQQAGSLLYGNPPVYISATINGVSASGFGTDVSLALHPTDALQVGGTFSYNDLKDDRDVTQNGIVLYPGGARLPFSPKYTASAFAIYTVPVNGDVDAVFKVSGNYRSREELRALGGGTQLTYCSVTGANQNAFCRSGAPLFVNPNVDISSHSGKTFSVYVQNLTNWNGLTDPSYSPTTPFRARPRTIGVQFETRF